MTLFKINVDIETLLNNSIDIETGEVNENILKDLEKLELDRNKKILDVAKYINSKKAEILAIKNAEKVLKERRLILENKNHRLLRYITEFSNNENFKDAEIRVSWRKSKSVNIIDIDKIDDIYIKKKIIVTADKTAIKKAIESNKVVAGAELIVNNNIQIK